MSGGINELGVRLTGNNSEYLGMLSDSAEKSGEFAGRIAEKVGEKLYGLRDISHAVATALGLNLEKIGENVARYFTGLTKEEEEAYKKSETLQDQIYEKQRKLAEMQLSDADRRNALIQDEARLQAFVDDARITSGKKQLEVDEAKIKLLDLGIERAALEAAMAKVADAERAKALDERRNTLAALGDIEHKAALSKLDDIHKEAALTAEIYALKKVILLASQDEAQQKRLNAELTQRQAELESIQAKNRTEHVKDLKEINKIKFESLPIEEQILTYQESMKTLQREIKTGLKEGRDTTQDQLSLLQNQETVNKLLITQATERKAAETSVTTEFQRQLRAIQQMTAEKTPGGLRSNNSAQISAAEAALKRAEQASQDPVANPNYIRDLYSAQLNLSDIQAGGKPGSINLDAASLSAGFGPTSSNAQVKILKDLAEAGRQQSSYAGKTSAGVRALVGVIVGKGSGSPETLDNSPYPTYNTGTSSDIDG